jgi:hypothetical protein
MVGLVFAVLGADRCRGGEAITEESAQLGKQGRIDSLMVKGGHGVAAKN